LSLTSQVNLFGPFCLGTQALDIDFTVYGVNDDYSLKKHISDDVSPAVNSF
jgi:hypothetical protein